TATRVRQVMYGMLAIDADVEEAEPLAEGFFHTRILAEIASQQGRFELAAYLNNLMRLAHFYNYNVLPPVTHSTDTGPTSQLGADVPVMHHARLKTA
ncbi:MAG: hypothetical protein IT567_02810, partial [Alphaproteobacteria bacterium]|nr:hypothetical protein [Alphaproteobacteria bacterium]